MVWLLLVIVRILYINVFPLAFVSGLHVICPSRMAIDIHHDVSLMIMKRVFLRQPPSIVMTYYLYKNLYALIDLSS
jgi:hypothetical protein